MSTTNATHAEVLRTGDDWFWFACGAGWTEAGDERDVSSGREPTLADAVYAASEVDERIPCAPDAWAGSGDSRVWEVSA